MICRIIIPIGFLVLLACNPTNKETSEKLRSAAENIGKQTAGLYQENVQPHLEATAHSAKELSDSVDEINQAKKNVAAGIEKTEKVIGTTRKKVSETKKGIKRGVKRIARRLPRSREEANRLAYDNGKKYLEDMKKSVDGFLKENGGLINKNR